MLKVCRPVCNDMRLRVAFEKVYQLRLYVELAYPTLCFGAMNVNADWPTDFQHLLPMLHDDMGHMIDMPSFTCSVERVDAYPTELKGAVQHNALWDARALRHRLEERT